MCTRCAHLVAVVHEGGQQPERPHVQPRRGRLGDAPELGLPCGLCLVPPAGCPRLLGPAHLPERFAFERPEGLFVRGLVFPPQGFQYNMNANVHGYQPMVVANAIPHVPPASNELKKVLLEKRVAGFSRQMAQMEFADQVRELQNTGYLL